MPIGVRTLLSSLALCIEQASSSLPLLPSFSFSWVLLHIHTAPGPGVLVTYLDWTISLIRTTQRSMPAQQQI